MKRFLALLIFFFITVGFFQSRHPGSIQDPFFQRLRRTSQMLDPLRREASKTSMTKTQQEMVLVSRVIDGDTIEITDGRRVRYIGMDTPEVADPEKPVECYGQEAKEENRRLVDSKTVRLEKDISETDSYGRLLRYVYVDDIMINEYLLRQGFGRIATFPPDVRYVGQFIKAQTEAMNNKRGLWSACPR